MKTRLNAGEAPGGDARGVTRPGRQMPSESSRVVMWDSISRALR